MAARVKPTIVASIISSAQPAGPGVTLPATVGIEGPADRQLSALQTLVDALDELKVSVEEPDGEKKKKVDVAAIDALIAPDAESVTIQIRRVGEGEVWVRAS